MVFLPIVILLPVYLGFSTLSFTIGALYHYEPCVVHLSSWVLAFGLTYLFNVPFLYLWFMYNKIKSSQKSASRFNIFHKFKYRVKSQTSHALICLLLCVALVLQPFNLSLAIIGLLWVIRLYFAINHKQSLDIIKSVQTSQQHDIDLLSSTYNWISKVVHTATQSSTSEDVTMLNKAAPSNSIFDSIKSTISSTISTLSNSQQVQPLVESKHSTPSIENHLCSPFLSIWTLLMVIVLLVTFIGQCIALYHIVRFGLKQKKKSHDQDQPPAGSKPLDITSPRSVTSQQSPSSISTPSPQAKPVKSA